MDIVGQYMDNKGKISTKNCFQSPRDGIICIKLEDVDIDEEFIDDNRVYNRQTYLEGESHDSSIRYDEKPISIKIEKTDELDANIVESSSFCKKLNAFQNDSDIEDKLYKDVSVVQKKHKCTLCDFESTHKKNLKRHINSVHLDSKRHNCHLCDYASYRKSTVKFHIETFHRNESKRHKCHLCDYAASLKIHLKVHVDSVHLKYKENQCHLCDHKANRKADLRRHIDTVHLKTKLYKCPKCSFSTSYKKNVDRHMDSVHSK